eukprot:CAMPEP_0201481670 /NCGR_PEP_ID=MMETSP0151_2-20130828/5940_1 /ASSEMBLY_ACC=CAM_ASM_000257 /TAXON_ID=200890 /ORGANISM="Paramoeba atlantica, Strain 621/1 / CCAP 1560/9" /LENGTH=80 /DNA_ID=CAMNT_0047863989 /DNA_START=165 /DNA_END=407 /DNA_ORIENTATION=+
MTDENLHPIYLSSSLWQMTPQPQPQLQEVAFGLIGAEEVQWWPVTEPVSEIAKFTLNKKGRIAKKRKAKKKGKLVSLRYR